MTTADDLPLLRRRREPGGQSAIVIVSTLPKVLLYPWLARYFFRNVLSGTVRG
ncbi:MAG TPA: hypothetical protein VFS62_13315 [Chloroflexota bacterium]|nr:hypothetical protein [Chloroflexota bacterium]